MVPFLIVLSLALGATSLWPFALLILTSLVVLNPALTLHANRRLIAPLALIIGSVAVSSLRSEFWAYGILYCETIAVLWMAGAGMKTGKLGVIPVVGMVVASAVVAVLQLENGLVRPDGLSTGPHTLGLAGMATMPYGAFLVGLSQSRTALLGMLIYGVFRPKLFVPVFVLIGLGVLFVSGGVQRLEVDSIISSIQHRAEIVKGTILIDGDCNGGAEVPGGTYQWDWLGHGFFNSCNTGHVTAHNIYANSLYDMGVFVVPFWVGVGLLWWRLGRNWLILTMVGITGLFVQDWYARIEGIYGIATLYVIDVKLGGNKSWASYHVLRGWFGRKLNPTVSMPTLLFRTGRKSVI